MSERTERRLAQITNVFRQRFGHAPEGVAEAPGRVNLIGEHLDYNGGSVLPVAIDRSVLVAFGCRNDGDITACSIDFDQESTFRLGNDHVRGSAESWAGYVRGVAACLSETSECSLGVDLVITGDVPVGAGLSSSAALEVAVAGALRAAWRVDIDERGLALLCQRAENEFVGVQCGVMDQFAAALARAEHALLIDCRALDTEYVPLALREHSAAIVVVDSGVRRALEHSDYNRRREECNEALRLLCDALPERSLSALCDVTPDDLERASLPERLLRRARHVVTEQSRVKQAAAALIGGELKAFGRLMNEAHASLRDDFDVSTAQLDRLIELAQGQEGVLGARLTGAGFGGCTVNLVRESALGAFEERVVGRYAHETSLPARMLVCQPSNGLCVHRVGAT